MIVDKNESGRNDSEEVMVQLLPDSDERSMVLQQLLESSELADSIAPNAWAVTLFNNGFRLNVGQVEVLVFVDGQLRVNLVGEVGAEPFVEDNFEAADYRSLPQPQCAFVGRVGAFAAVESALRSSHQQFVKLAASTRSGQPREGSPFRRFHCEELLQYARDVTNEWRSDLAKTPESGLDFTPGEQFDMDSPKAREGYEIDRRILARGRNASLASLRKERDDYTCQACGFKLQLDGKFVIEVHHTEPLATTGATDTPIEQPVSLCPTCHRIAHLRGMPYSVEEIRGIRSRS